MRVENRQITGRNKRKYTASIAVNDNGKELQLVGNYLVLKSGYIITNSIINLLPKNLGMMVDKYRIQVYDKDFNKVVIMSGETREYVITQALETEREIALFNLNESGIAESTIVVDKISHDYKIEHNNTRYTNAYNFVIKNDLTTVNKPRQYSIAEAKFRVIVGNFMVVQRDKDIIAVGLKDTINNRKRYEGKITEYHDPFIIVENKGKKKIINLYNEVQVPIEIGESIKLDRIGDNDYIVLNSSNCTKIYNFELKLLKIG